MKHFAVFGNPISHSQSPFIHSHFAQQLNIDVDYQAILSPLDRFSETIMTFFQQGGEGCNVTVPFKVEAFNMCDELSDAATAAGAVNTLYYQQGKLVGDNTDGMGLVSDLLRLGVTLDQANVLMIGAGGAARGAILPLLNAGISQLTVANRTPQKALALAEQFGNPRLSGSSLEDIPLVSYDVIISASSAGLSDTSVLLSNELVTSNTFCYDMIYGESETPFCHWARSNQCLGSADGLGMLVAQAAESFSIWTGQQPNTSETLSALRKRLGYSIHN